MKSKYIKWSAFGTLLTLTVVMVIATIIEKLFGREQVMSTIYGSWWFVALWGILVLTSVCYIFNEKLYKQKAVFLSHCSLFVILCGAFVTFLSADRGYIHIRQNQILNYYISEEDNERHQVPFDIKLLLFEIEYGSETDHPIDFISYLRIDGEVCQVSMNKIYQHEGYRFYQLEYDNDEMGATLLVNHDPWGIAVTYAGYLLLAISALWILWLRLSWKGLLGISVVTAILWYYISQMNPMTPILRSPMLAAHVSIIMTAYLLFILIAVFSIVALCSKRKSDKLYRWNQKLLFPALFLLVMGIFLGAVWANISWGRYWGWDSKETWALITLIVYAIPMHRNSFKAFRSSRYFHLYCSIAILAVGMTFFGVSFLLGGIHSYI
jgi:ABC-type transport system involved in cytochrome c biogenesis permease subunit